MKRTTHVVLEEIGGVYHINIYDKGLCIFEKMPTKEDAVGYILDCLAEMVKVRQEKHMKMVAEFWEWEEEE